MSISRLIVAAALLAVGGLLAGCSGGSSDEAGSSSAGSQTQLPSAIALPSGKPIDVKGDLIIYRDTLAADAVVSTLDHARTWKLDFDPKTDSVLAVDCTKDGGRAAYLMENNTSLDNRLVIVDSDGRREYELTGQVVGAALSPDGSQVAYTAYLPQNARGIIALVDVHTGQIKSVMDRPGTIGAPRWSPDGQEIVFDASVDRGNQLFVYTMGESGAAQLTTVPQSAFGPDWSPDGSAIVFSSFTDAGNPQLFTIPAGGGQVSQLTSTQVFKANPRWSADGSKLAYVGTRQVPTTSRLPLLALRHNVGVFTSAPDGSNEALFTDYAIDAWLLGWCTAGPWLGQGWTEK